jgi:hypothetical protein
MYRDPPRPHPVGVTVGGNGGDALRAANLHLRAGLGQFVVEEG